MMKSKPIFPLTLTQQDIYFHQLHHPHSPLYNIGGYIRCCGRIDIKRLIGAHKAVVKKHDIFGLRILADNGNVQQSLSSGRTYDLPMVDFSGMDKGLSVASQWLQNIFAIPLNYENTELFKSWLVKINVEQYWYVGLAHHLMIDGWGFANWAGQLASYYNESSSSNKRFSDIETRFSWQKVSLRDEQYLKSQRHHRDKAFWLKHCLPVPDSFLSAHYGHQLEEKYSSVSSRYVVSLSLSSYSALKFLTQSLTAGTPQVLLGLLAGYFSLVSGQDRLCFGVPVHNRKSAIEKSMIGVFSHVNPLLLQVDKNKNFQNLVYAIVSQQKINYRHQHFPMGQIVQHAGLSGSGHGLYEIAFNYLLLNSQSFMLDEVAADLVYQSHQHEQTPLTVTVWEGSANKLEIYLDYHHTYFNADEIGLLANRLEHLLITLRENLSTPLCQLSVIPPVEREFLLQVSNPRQIEYPFDKTIQALFEKKARECPGDMAVVCGEQQLSYEKLNEQANQLAHYLLESGVELNNPIGICVERSERMAVGLLAILKVGCHYVPLDPHYPTARLQFIAKDSELALILLDSNMAAHGLFDEIPSVLMDEPDAFFSLSSRNPQVLSSNQNLAYLIYTSGSTGLPKGVEVSHRNVVNFLYSMQEQPGFISSDRLLAVTPISFDIHVLEWYLPIITGGTVVVGSREECMDGRLLAECMNKHAISIMQATPSTWQMLLDSGCWSPSHPLKALCGGESLDRGLAQALREKAASLWNMYGPTETSIWSSCADISDPQTEITIGKPIANTEFYVLNQAQQLQVTGVYGELYIGGDGVARGYKGQTALTKEKFISHPFSSSPGARLYRTGDWVRCLSDGRFAIAGRLDDQIKIRGFRIEPGEIEHRISRCPGVISTVVLARDDRTGSKQLVAYMVVEESNNNQHQYIAQIKAYLQSTLPSYMVPTAYMIMAELPLTPNGKIDRKALPIPDKQPEQDLYIAPKTATEKVLVKIWAGLLKLAVEKISASDNFFELGGHSLLAVRLVSAIRMQEGRELPVKIVFENPVLRTLAEKIDNNCGRLLRQTVTAVSHQSLELPLSYAQQRLWFIEQLEVDNPQYNMPAAFKVMGDFDVGIAEQAIIQIIKRHESLRTQFIEREHGPIQTVREAFEFQCASYDLSHLGQKEQEQQLNGLIKKDFYTPFDLTADLMIRASYLYLSGKKANKQSIFLFNMHHIVSDGWSVGVLIKEFEVQYQALLNGQQDPLPALAIQYVDYAHWQRVWLASDRFESQLSYWDQQIADAPAVHNLPMDFPRPETKLYEGGLVKVHLSTNLSSQLQQLAHDQAVTLFMLLQGMFALLLSRHSHSDDILMGTPVANRMQAELEPLIGFFVNTLVLRTHTQYQTLVDYLQHIKQVNLDAQANQDVPFDYLVEHCRVPRSTQYTPLFQIMFSMNTNEVEAIKLPGVNFSPIQTDNIISKFDLDLTVQWIDGKICLSWVYDKSLFSRENIERLNNHYIRLLTYIIDKPDTVLQHIPMLSGKEIHELIHTLNNTPEKNWQAQLIHPLFEEQATLTPDKVAVVFDHKEKTYQELNEDANRLAHYLRSIGVDGDILVGVCFEKCYDMLVAILAVLKSGGAYVPLDPSYPNDRLQFMLEESQLHCLLAHSQLLVGLDLAKPLQVIELNTLLFQQILNDYPSTDPELTAKQNPSNLAYIIYTSGSTGQPKGVMVEHAGLYNLANEMQNWGLCGDDKGWGWNASYGFDASLQAVLQLFMGRRLIILPDAVKHDPKKLENWVNTYDIGVMDCTPALVELWFGFGVSGSLPNLVIGGEPISDTLWEQLLEWQKTNRIAWNVYGPTECTVNSTYCQIQGLHPHIGRPLNGVFIYLLDTDQQLVPKGALAELYIGGEGIARGYLNQIALTAEKFIQNPLCDAPGKRLYRTGDLVRYTSGNRLEFISRVDDQVKIRGFRIELDEIKYLLQQHDSVEEALVLTQESGLGDKKLIAYLRPTQQLLDRQDVRVDRDRIDEWQDMFDNTYSHFEEGNSNSKHDSDTKYDPDIKHYGDEPDIIGWNCSYRDQLIPPGEMQEWLEGTVEAIKGLRPKRLLEIGVGTGMLLYRYAQDCECVYATDLSSRVLEQVTIGVSQRNWKHVTLSQGDALDLSAFRGLGIDTIILNSVVQYFPSAQYFRKVLREMMSCLVDGGKILLGDIRNLDLLNAFSTSVALYKAEDTATAEDVLQTASFMVQNEEELLFSPGFFASLPESYPGISQVDIMVKHGSAMNEMMRFRYDVVLYKKTKSNDDVKQWYDWQGIKQLQDLFAQNKSDFFGITGFVNQRIERDLLAVNRLNNNAVANVKELKETIVVGSWSELDKLKQLATSHHYQMKITWGQSDLGYLDLIFIYDKVRRQPSIKSFRSYAQKQWVSAPQLRSISRQLVPELKQLLEQSLPEYMLPNAYLLLEKFPLNRSGKIDKSALPKWVAMDSGAYIAADTELEKQLQNIWQKILNQPEISIESDFFTLGGHSLLAIRLVNQIKQELNIEIGVKVFFECSNIKSLAHYIETFSEQDKLNTVFPPIEKSLRTFNDSTEQLSYAQQRLWFIDQLQGGSAQYNMPVALQVDGEFDVAAAEQAIIHIIERHESLRTVFAELPSGPVQIIQNDFVFTLHRYDLSKLEKKQQEEKVRGFIRENNNQVFDLSKDLMVRATYLDLSGEACAQQGVLLFCMHHIASDGWSIGILIEEFAKCYQVLVQGIEDNLTPLVIQYADYAHWQRQWLQGEILDKQLAYWNKQLDGIPPLHSLPLDYPRPRLKKHAGSIVKTELSEELYGQLQQMARECEMTLFMLLHAALGLLLSRHSNTTDIVLGTPMANRMQVEVEPLIGFFANTLVLRTNTDYESLKDYLAHVRQVNLNALANQDVPFEQLVEHCQVPRSTQYSPLFQVLFTMNNSSIHELCLPGLKISPLKNDDELTKFDLSIRVQETRKGLIFTWLYDKSLFTLAHIEQLSVHLQQLLSNMILSPQARLCELSLLTTEEQYYLLHELNQPKNTYNPDEQVTVIQQLFEQQCRRNPQAIALRDDRQCLSYQMLEERSNQLAHYLQARGMGFGAVIGICTQRDSNLVIAVLGILKTGAAYVPMDSSYPVKRLEFIVRDSQMRGLLVDEACPALSVGGDTEVIDLVKVHEDILAYSTGSVKLNHTQSHDDPCYLVYTSGSSGEPKGVVMSHRVVVNFISTVSVHSDRLTEPLWMLQYASPGFDMCFTDIFLSLSTGGGLRLISREIQQDLPSLLELLVQEKLQRLNLPYVVLQHLAVETLQQNIRLPNLQVVISTAEALCITPAIREFFSAHPSCQLVNHYGPSETHVVTGFMLSGPTSSWPDMPPIGTLLPNQSAYVLDKNQQLVPFGAIGELHLGEWGTANGYHRRPQLTKSAFISNPYIENERLYRTGDLVRYLAEGNLQFLGRRDEQLKIRGFRVELGEIEQQLFECGNIASCAVLACSKDGGEKQLIAYVVLKDNSTSDVIKQLRKSLQSLLPDYMVPNAFVILDEMPLTSNGKVDRRKLPEPCTSDFHEIAYVAPRTDLEQYLCGLWQDALQRKQVGIHDDFFDLGGHSLLATRIFNQLQKYLEVKIHVVALFDAPTVARFVDYLKQHHAPVLKQKGLLSPSYCKDDGEAQAAAEITEGDLEQLQKLIPVLPEVPSKKTKKNGKAVFILSPHRSGSTLLRVMLAGHPDLFAPPELELLGFDTLAQRREIFSERNAFWLEGTLRALMELQNCSLEVAQQQMAEYEQQGMSTQQFYQQLQSRMGSTLLVDKTPSYSYHPAILQQAEACFDEAYYIHLVRHPLGMISSFEKIRLEQLLYLKPHTFPPRQLAELIWTNCHQNILEFLQDIPASRQHRLSFESLVSEPETVMRRLCEFLTIPYADALLQPYDTSQSRMTDGIRNESLMLGDVNFLENKKINSETKDAWQQELIASGREQSLSERTKQLAESLGYEDVKPTLTVLPEIKPISDRSHLPLSFSQQRLWFIDQLEGGSPAYNMPVALLIESTEGVEVQFSIEAAEQAMAGVIEDHEVLRTVFTEEQGEPVQRINNTFRFAIFFHDLSDSNQEQQDLQIKEYMHKDQCQAFNLSCDLMIRVSFLCLSVLEGKPLRGILLVNMHHIASDGWSIPILVKEFTRRYQAIMDQEVDVFPSLPIQYVDYAYWQRQWLQGEVLRQQLNYWTRQLSECPPVHALPLDYPRPATKVYEGAVIRTHFSTGLMDKLQKVARENHLTLFMLLHGVLGLLLSRHSDSHDIVIGTPVANRTRVELESLVGFFVNTLVLRIDTKHILFRDYIAHVRQVNLDAQANQDVPFEYLVEHCQVPRNTEHSPLFQILLNVNMDEKNDLHLPGLDISTFDSNEVIVKFDLEINVKISEEGLSFSWIYDKALFTADHVQQLMDHYQRLLHSIVEKPDAPLAELSMLSQQEMHYLLLELNDTKRNYPENHLIHELFEQQVALIPDHRAVVFEDQQLTYKELNESANRLAHYLREQGVGVESLVGICAERSLEMVIGLLGILKAGGAYVPLDPAYPQVRLQYVLEDTGLQYLLIQNHFVDKLPPLNSLCTVVLDGKGYDELMTACPSTNLDKLQRQKATNLAYVIYTSGSTGQPKGVMVEHRALVNRIDWMQKAYGISSSDRVLQKTPYSFDVSVWEFFWSLGYGAGLVMAKPEGHKDPVYLSELIEQQEVSILHFVPSMLHVYLSVPEAMFHNHVRYVFCSGEALETQDVKTFLAQVPLPQVELHNLYGPTEAAIDVTYFDCSQLSGQENVPIGRPIQNIQLYILQQNLLCSPPGVTGELHIGGDGLARGYWNRDELTQEKFIKNPFSENGKDRLYKTGDRVRYLADGNLEYLGRLDDQIKLRGFRIELGEIESHLLNEKYVVASLVLVREKEAGDKQLVAYVIADKHQKDKAKVSDNDWIVQLHQHSQKVLPDYMVPSGFVIMEEWPLTANGKIDKKALPALNGSLHQGEYIAPETSTEKIIAEIWSKLLKLDMEKLSITANFFELGGHSLLIVRFVSMANAEFDVEASIREVIESPTIKYLGKLYDEKITEKNIDFQNELEALEGLSEEEIDNLLAELDIEE